MKKIHGTLLKWMGWFEESVSVVMLTVTIAITAINVFARYFFKSSIPWAQEVTGIAWTWTVMLGISWGYRRNMHMGVDIIVEKLNPKWKKAIYVLSFSILFLSFLFMTYMSIMLTINGAYKLTNYFKLPYSCKYIAAVIAFAFMSIYSARFVYLAITRPDDFLKCVAIEGNGLDDLDNPQPEGDEAK